jgi:hypothetical protein
MTASLLAGAALLIAVVAFTHSRRTARQLAQMTELYWQLKFDHGELKAKVDPSTPPAPEPKQTFVPLTRLRPDAKAAPGFGAAGSPQDK